MQGNRNNTLYYATDPHLFFTFNEFYSREWNLFIENTNKGGGTKTVTSPDSSVSFTTPDYADITYYLGTTKKQKTFKHTLAANGLTEDDVGVILNALQVGTEGFLVYDTNPYWGWDVVVTKVGDITKYCAQDGLIVEFEVEFKTYGDWRAKGVYPASVSVNSTDTPAQNLLTNEYGIPELIVNSKDSNEYWLIPVSDEPSAINVFTSDVVDSDKKPGTAHLQVASVAGNTETLAKATVKNMAYYSDLGIALSGAQFVEEIDTAAQVTRRMFKGTAPSLGAPFADTKECAGNYDQSTYWYQCEVYEITQTDYWDRVKDSVSIPTTIYNIQIFELATGKVSGGGAQWEAVVARQLYTQNNKPETMTALPIATYYGKCEHLILKTESTGNKTITVIKYKNL